MDSISSLFWAIVFIAVISIITVGAFVLGFITLTILVPIVCALATLQALALVLAACAIIARHVRRMAGLPDPESDDDPMLNHHGDVPAVKRGGR
jgi:hypothetical protein